jgi:MFS-type transporter involved in bile tolerance (Atg22 family)
VASFTHTWAVFCVALLGPGVIGLAGIWTAGRAALLELVPEDRVGAYFGIYGMATKLSVVGSLTYGFVADYVISTHAAVGEDAVAVAKAAGHRTALGVQLIPLAIGLVLIFWCWRLAQQRPRFDERPAETDPSPTA